MGTADLPAACGDALLHQPSANRPPCRVLATHLRADITFLICRVCGSCCAVELLVKTSYNFVSGLQGDYKPGNYKQATTAR